MAGLFLVYEMKMVYFLSDEGGFGWMMSFIFIFLEKDLEKLVN